MPHLRPVVIALAVLVVASTAVARQRVFVVNSVDDQRVDRCDGEHCTLREAILSANQVGGAEIRFDLPRWPYRYEPLAALPALRGNVFVNGASQGRTRCPLPTVQIDGSRMAGQRTVNGLEILGDGNRVRGLIITNFSGHGVVVNGRENELTCLYVGVGATGTEPQGNGGHGIAVIGGHSNWIGSPDPRDTNLLSDNGGFGLYIEDALNTHRHNNGIGIDILGNAKLPNGNVWAGALNPPPAPSPLSARALAELQKVIRDRIASIMAENATALERSDLYVKYASQLTRDPTRARPRDLNQLTASLVQQPKLYAAFSADAAAVVSDARAAMTADVFRLYAAYNRAVPSFGRDAPMQSEDRRDALVQALKACSPDACAASMGPSNIVAVEANPGIGLSPMRWHSLTTYGPTAFSSEIGNISYFTTCLGITASCFWPIVYDLLPHSATLKWETNFTAQEVADMVEQDGYFLRLKVNGQTLQIGPASGTAVQQGYHAATIANDLECPAGKHCIDTSVRVRNVLKFVPQPWVFELEITQLIQLDFPIFVGIDELGNFLFATHESQRVAIASRTIQPNPTGGQKWFTVALAPTFQHARCTHCHSLDDEVKLAAHHWPNSDPTGFVSSTDLHLEPSGFVPGAHVIACTNCHVLPATNADGFSFHENEWLTPYFDLQVNWGQMSVAQICSRVKTNLPTTQLRDQHFHGDARLFWAIEDPRTPGGPTLPKAPPGNFNEFLRRVDLWNYLGAPCP